MFCIHPANEHQHQSAVPPVNTAVDKFAGAIKHTYNDNGNDHWQKAFFKIFYHILFPAELPAHIHEKSKLWQGQRFGRSCLLPAVLSTGLHH